MKSKNLRLTLRKLFSTLSICMLLNCIAIAQVDWVDGVPSIKNTWQNVAPVDNSVSNNTYNAIIPQVYYKGEFYPVLNDTLPLNFDCHTELISRALKHLTHQNKVVKDDRILLAKEENSPPYK